MRGALCSKLHRPPSQLLFALQQSSMDSQLFVDNRDFCLPHMHSTPPLGGRRWNITMTFGMEKTRVVWLPDGENILKICSFVSTESANATDRRTDTA